MPDDRYINRYNNRSGAIVLVGLATVAVGYMVLQNIKQFATSNLFEIDQTK
jgi:hypothetical protein